MLKISIAAALAVVGILMKGLLHLSIADLVVVLMVPFLILYKLLGNRPQVLGYAGLLGLFAGAASFFHGYIVVPIQYYSSIWGWNGIVFGVVSAFLLPLELFVFLGVAYFKGGAAVYIGKFIGGICFGISGWFLVAGSAADNSWAWLSRRNKTDAS